MEYTPDDLPDLVGDLFQVTCHAYDPDGYSEPRVYLAPMKLIGLDWTQQLTLMFDAEDQQPMAVWWVDVIDLIPYVEAVQ